jgi:hypothetical protein
MTNQRFAPPFDSLSLILPSIAHGNRILSLNESLGHISFDPLAQGRLLSYYGRERFDHHRRGYSGRHAGIQGHASR